ncbi:MULTISPECIES: DUF1697 domain-containing protein [Sphingomonas]|uniref:DUF1697 domain-containing protein n=1 Tax=Sphingomonas TaxID=13687 RepID=UPI000DEF1A75|nr:MULTISPECIES: DUF1697 domain-containing protein [Sphingomonas]
MPGYAALLRAVNVSGTGKLPMTELKRMGDECGFTGVRTYIASGNLIFASPASEAKVVALLDAQVERWFGKAVPVMVRNADELAAIVAANPFPDVAGNRLGVSFLAAAPDPDLLDQVRGRQDERTALGTREVYIAYGAGMADSKLTFPGMGTATARNMNTVRKLAELAAEVA